MQEARPRRASTSIGAQEARGSTEPPRNDERLARFLDDQLDQIFGPSFSPVIEHVMTEQLGVGLYFALLTRPTRAFESLGQIFRGWTAVALIFQILDARLQELDMSEESHALRAVLESFAPLVRQLKDSSP